MNTGAAEIDLKLRDDFYRYLREYGIESTLIDPLLAVLFRTLASQIYQMSSDMDRMRTALLDELLQGLGFERRFAHPAQTVLRFHSPSGTTHLRAGTNLFGEPDSGGRMSFLSDYGITVSPARIAAVFVYQPPEPEAFANDTRTGELRLLSGVELPEDTLRAGPAYGPIPAALGKYPAIYIAIEQLGSGHLSRHGLFLQTSPEATLLNTQLATENWCVASADGRFGAAGVLRPRPINAGQHRLAWLEGEDTEATKLSRSELPSLPGGFWHSKCFVLPAMQPQHTGLCEAPLGLNAPLRMIFERPALFLAPRAWLRIQLDSHLEPLHTAISTVLLHAQSASNVHCWNQTVRFAEHGTTIPVSQETGARSYLVSPLSITGQGGQSYLPEFHPSFQTGVGRYRLRGGLLTLLPGKLAGGEPETYANVRLWTTTGSSGNQMGAGRLHNFADEPPVRNLTVENVTAAAGGTDGEALHAAQKRFSEALLSRHRLLTRADIETSVRAFDHRIHSLQIDPVLARSQRGLRRLHRITVFTARESFHAPEEEARILVGDLERFLADRVPLDVAVSVELAWA